MFPFSTRILIADDMATIRMLVMSTLVELGYYDIVEAPDGQAAWDQLDTARPHFELVISDLNMPNMNGLELLKKVRADSRFANLPFVLLTAESEVNQVKEAVAAGVSNYLVKPFAPDVFKQKLQQTYQRARVGMNT